MLKIAYSDVFRYLVPEKHRFPMQKYTMIPERLLAEGTISDANFFAPSKLSEEEILTTHTADYWHKLKTQTLRYCGTFYIPHSYFNHKAIQV